MTVRDALDAVGVPAVINGAGSVFATPAAREWLRLLEALERPASPVRARAATMTSFLGWTAEQVAAASDDEWEDVHRRLHAWAAVLRRRGLASLTETITLVERLPGRVLRVVDGERRLTDLRHVGQLLHGAAAAETLGTAALAVWLRQRVDGRRARGRRGALAPPGVRRPGRPGADDPPLQGPRVPGRLRARTCGSRPGSTRSPARSSTTTPTPASRRTIDVGLAGEAYKRHKEQHVDEQRGEDLRLAYVALTRAKHQAVVWWAGSWNSRDSALVAAAVRPRRRRQRRLQRPAPAVRRVRARPLPRARRGRPGLRQRRAHRAPRPPGRLVRHAARRPRELGAADLRPPAGPRLAPHLLQRHHRRLPRGPRRERARRGRVTDEPADDEPRPAIAAARAAAPAPMPPRRGADSRPPPARRRRLAPGGGTMSPLRRRRPAGRRPRPRRPPLPPAAAPRPRRRVADAALLSVPALLAAGPGGTAFGTFAHTVFEAADFAAPDLDAELARAVSEALARRPVDIGDRATVIAGLKAAIETPLGPLVGGRRLQDFARADRLDELTFELPLAGGDEPPGQITPRGDRGRPARAARARRPAVGYADRLADPELRAGVRGYLTGSIDLVVRVGEGVRDRRLQDELARRARRGADGVASPPGGARRRDGARALSPAGAALHRRAAPLSALAAARAMTRSATSPACCTCSCAG